MDLNISTLRVFCKVVEVQSFSGASRALGITQPTVSQQIARVEEYLGAKAFERVGREIFLTTLGEQFSRFAQEIVERADDFSSVITEERKSLSGLVCYGLQEACQWTEYYRQIMARLNEFPEIRFRIEVLSNEPMLKRIKEGDLDFGFAVGNNLDPDLRFEYFGDEHYSLVSRDAKLFAPLKEKNFDQLRLITYPGWESFFATWLKAYGHEAKAKRSIRPVIQVGSLAGTIHAIQQGAGVAVVPTHSVRDLIKTTEFIVFEKNKTQSAAQAVHLVTRLGEKYPKRTQLIIDLHRGFKEKKF